MASGPRMALPVFAYPDELIFNAHDREHHKQMITLYNPYGFPIRYRVTCTSPELFTLQDCEGSLSDRHTTALVVRLSKIPPYSVVPIENKFRVQIYDGRTRSRQEAGRKVLLSKISFDPLPPPGGAAMSSAGSEHGSFRFEGSTSAAAVAAAAAAAERDEDLYRGGRGSGPAPPHVNYVAVATAIVCIFALLLPNEKEPSPNIPIYLHLSINMKLMIAYALGLVTMVIFRP